MIEKLKSELLSISNPKKAEGLKRFFKTAKGQYGEGDIFIGVTVPKLRALALKYSGMSPKEATLLLHSPVHEERLVSLFILIRKFEKGDENEKEWIYSNYLKSTSWINNWDLVDLSADKIVGAYLYDKQKDILYTLAKSSSLWERRISIIATFNFIKKGNCEETFKIIEILLNDKHDLIHKAAGWMLREAGKRCSEDLLKEFLLKNYKVMPRTMLRYAIERMPEEIRKTYLYGTA
jgi:3-methyladenine DNA glycosylase AlkD